MFLRRLRIVNFRSFDQLELDFALEDAEGERVNRPWTVLLGDNGIGKSNLLRAIALVTAGSDALPDLVGEPEDWIRYKQDECCIEALLTTKEGEERHLRLELRRGDTRSEIVKRNHQNLAPLDAALEHTKRNYFVVGYGTSRRLSEGTHRMRNQSSGYQDLRSQNVATLFDPDAILNPLESWAMDLDYRHEDGLDVVQQVLEGFLDGVEFQGIDKERGRLMFKTEDGVVPLSALSDGYQNIAAWIGDLLYRITETFEDYRAPLEARGLLLVDEIGLHLHPSWQRQLLDYISRKLPNFQRIVTTHSPMTAQQAGEGELFYLRRDEGRVRLFPFQGSPRHLLLHQLLLSSAFALPTDESFAVESAKHEYRELRDQDSRSESEQVRLEALSFDLQAMPSSGDSPVVTDHQMDLLRRIDQELTAKGS